MHLTKPHGWSPFAWLAVAAALLVSTNSQAQWKTHWDYDGPKGADHWSDLDPAYATCNAGKEQSPIDIQSAGKASLPTLRFDSKFGPLKYLLNNGYTIRVNYHDAPGTGNLMIVGDQRYQLTQFHFHRPSEEYIHGKPFDMVAHLMYQASDGKVVGVAVLLQIEAFAKLYPHDVRPLQPLNGRVVQESQ